MYLTSIISLIISLLLSVFGLFNKVNTINVANAIELKQALKVAKPGDEIMLKDGLYQGNFVIAASSSGTREKPIKLTGSRNAILDANTTQTGYVLYVQADFWIIKGITLQNGLKGLVTDEASFNIIDNIEVTQVGEEAIHFRKFSKHNIVKNSEVSYTGLKTPDYGEGIYIGTAYSNWSKISNGEPDKCDSNQVINNKIGPFVAAECIDIKEGTTGGIISGNSFESKGIVGANYADSWIDIKGNYYVIENNIGNNSQPSVLLDGYQVNCALNGWGNYNKFKNNTSNVNSQGYGFKINLKSSKGLAIGNIVYKSNIVNGAKSGVANISTTN
jgi:hypothetical protein